MLPNDSNDDLKLALKISGKSLEKNHLLMQELMLRTMSESNFTESQRIKELLDSLPSRNNITKPRITGSGSTVFLLFEKQKDLVQYKNATRLIIKNCWNLSTYIFL